MEELSYVLTQYFVSCVHVRFYFSLPLIFTLLAANISHFLTAALYFHVFLPVRNSSPLFLITRSSSLSVIHVSVNIKINAEKGTISLLFFLSKSPGGHVISFHHVISFQAEYFRQHGYRNNFRFPFSSLLYKTPVVMRFPAKITLSCIWAAIPVDWVILHWYACGADGRSGVRSRDYQIFSDG